MPEPAASQIIAGKYRLEQLIGHGGMGSVWRAIHLTLDMPVAVKFMAPQALADPESRRRFDREARSLAALRTPNIVQVLDHGVDDDTPYIVMEYLEGEDLSSRLNERRRLPLSDVSRLFLQVARALRRAHDAGIVHRDLKPSNIFLARIDDEEVVKVLDFGVAKLVQAGALSQDQLTKAGTLLGSPGYMSPEQARGKEVDFRSDLWALAVIVFRAVTGEKPFAGDSLAELVIKLCIDPRPVPTKLAPDLPPAVDRFFEKAFAANPEDRFGSAVEMANAFASMLGQPALEMSRIGASPVAALTGDNRLSRSWLDGPPPPAASIGVVAAPGPGVPPVPGLTKSATPPSNPAISGPLPLPRLPPPRAPAPSQAVFQPPLGAPSPGAYGAPSPRPSPVMPSQDGMGIPPIPPGAEAPSPLRMPTPPPGSQPGMPVPGLSPYAPQSPQFGPIADPTTREQLPDLNQPSSVPMSQKTMVLSSPGTREPTPTPASFTGFAPSGAETMGAPPAQQAFHPDGRQSMPHGSAGPMPQGSPQAAPPGPGQPFIQNALTFLRNLFQSWSQALRQTDPKVLIFAAVGAAILAIFFSLAIAGLRRRHNSAATPESLDDIAAPNQTAEPPEAPPQSPPETTSAPDPATSTDSNTDSASSSTGAADTASAEPTSEPVAANSPPPAPKPTYKWIPPKTTPKTTSTSTTTTKKRTVRR